MEGDVQTGELEVVGSQNLNDLQNYLVHFNKEIEVSAADPSFQHNVSQIITQASQPVFVTVPVSSETSTPDEEQLPVITEIKDEKPSTDTEGIMVSEEAGDTTLADSGDQLILITENGGGVDESDHGPMETDFTSEMAHGLPVQSTIGAQIEEISSSLEQVVAAGNQAQQGFVGSEGLVMLPVVDGGTILSSTDPRLVQIVNVNGQPTLQVVNGQSALQLLNGQTPVQVSGQSAIQMMNRQVLPEQPAVQVVSSQSMPHVIDASIMRQPETSAVQFSGGLTQPTNVVESSVSPIDGTDPVAVLASVAANTNNINHLHSLQLSSQDMSGAQLVALRNSADSSQPQLVAVQMDEVVSAVSGGVVNVNPAGFQPQILGAGDSLQMGGGPLLLNNGTGYQSVAIVPSGDGNQQEEVNYVLIVNQTTNKDSLQGPVYDFGDNIHGEVVEELTDEDGTTKRLVKIKQLLAKRSLNDISAIPVGDSLMCSYCNYTSPKRYLLSRHMKSHSEDRPHKCSLCERGFKTLASLQNHVNTHTGTRPHKCKLCESAFTTSGELVRHIRYKHTFEKPHKCSECDYASVELSKLKRHMRSHTGERPYACAHCNYASPDTYKLKRHMRIHTGEKPYECETCHAKFTQSNSLKAHRLIHSGNKPVFQCTMCPATCGRKTDLKIHMQKLHTSDRPLGCKKCGHTFPDRYTFKMHMKSHEGEKCFRCNECDYAAMSQRHLETHMLTHTGIKPFECEDCDLAFRQKQLLKRHRNLYHNPDYSPPDPKDKEHECKECEKAFAHRGNLVRHIQNSHEDTEESPGLHHDDMDEEGSGIHTCGGCPKSVGDMVTPLTADQLIENSLLADMKEGKLGTSPKVVVVHPDGRVEEVTAKLQSLSQSKPVDDFLVSLGVTGDTHFDQVAGIPSDVCVAADSAYEVVTGTDPHQDIVLMEEDHSESKEIVLKDDAETYSAVLHPMATIHPDLPLDQTKEESTQASFDSDDDETKKLKILTPEQLLKLTQVELEPAGGMPEGCDFKVTQHLRATEASIQQIMVSVLQSAENEEVERRNIENANGHPAKRFKITVDPS